MDANRIQALINILVTQNDRLEENMDTFYFVLAELKKDIKQLKASNAKRLEELKDDML